MKQLWPVPRRLGIADQLEAVSQEALESTFDRVRDAAKAADWLGRCRTPGILATAAKAASDVGQAMLPAEDRDLFGSFDIESKPRRKLDALFRRCSCPLYR